MPASHGRLRVAGQEPGDTRSLDSGIRLLRVLAERPDEGWRLPDLAAVCGLDEAEALRVLDCLAEARMVMRREDGRRFAPGPLMFELALALPQRARFQRRAEELLRSFAQRMDGVALLLLRSGSDFVCGVREGLAASLPALAVTPGTRAPLFVAAGGVAILQRLPTLEASDVLKENTAREVVRRGTARLQALERMRDDSARHGFGVNAGGVVAGLHSFGVAVLGARGEPFAAVCLAGPPERFPLARATQLRTELEGVAASLAGEAHRYED
ncbi:helix-turn-helix domain-containing protein [Ramlibacter sp. G-1-2-2]|uniref:Helix-turn-helix domain-containing protein n=1 Tax=Ramlibacter agri TaxID=2728837 RepID=A0A848HFZ5_9BURK|nr:IclR family transcriptional regulator C-terminal domain-containing protein [Ramlibacter agri]NML47433.1 helix-turn-helix domain-containing protein [Ramlibacter agri]